MTAVSGFSKPWLSTTFASFMRKWVGGAPPAGRAPVVNASRTAHRSNPEQRRRVVMASPSAATFTNRVYGSAAGLAMPPSAVALACLLEATPAADP